MIRIRFFRTPAGFEYTMGQPPPLPPTPLNKRDNRELGAPRLENQTEGPGLPVARETVSG